MSTGKRSGVLVTDLLGNFVQFTDDVAGRSAFAGIEPGDVGTIRSVYTVTIAGETYPV